MINARVAQLKTENFSLNPVNASRYENPFLLKSTIQALNDIANKQTKSQINATNNPVRNISGGDDKNTMSQSINDQRDEMRFQMRGADIRRVGKDAAESGGLGLSHIGHPRITGEPHSVIHSRLQSVGRDIKSIGGLGLRPPATPLLPTSHIHNNIPPHLIANQGAIPRGLPGAVGHQQGNTGMGSYQLGHLESIPIGAGSRDAEKGTHSRGIGDGDVTQYTRQGKTLKIADIKRAGISSRLSAGEGERVIKSRPFISGSGKSAKGVRSGTSKGRPTEASMRIQPRSRTMTQEAGATTSHPRMGLHLGKQVSGRSHTGL